MTNRDPTTEQPERFSRAMRVACGDVCIWPKCDCVSVPNMLRKGIASWEAPPPSSYGEKADGNGVS